MLSAHGVVPLADLADLKILILREALTRHQDEYKELLENWRDLERKAQATVTIAAAFLAGLIAFVRQLPNPLPTSIAVFLILAVILLLFVFMTSIFVFTVQQRRMSPPSTTVYQFASELLNAITDPEELANRIPNFLIDNIRLWKGTNDDIFAINKDKAEKLWRCHVILIADIMVVFVLIVLSILNV